MTTEQRHNNMSAIRGRDTKPEMKVRRFLWHRGYRFLVNVREMPGKPDVVLRGRYRVCVFVNGCFWHGHVGCRYYTVPKTNREFWVAKVARNQERDRAVVERLKNAGWHCITVWECELRKDVCEETLLRLERTIRMIGDAPKAVKGYDADEEERIWKAAEGELYN